MKGILEQQYSISSTTISPTWSFDRLHSLRTKLPISFFDCTLYNEHTETFLTKKNIHSDLNLLKNRTYFRSWISPNLTAKYNFHTYSNVYSFIFDPNIWII